MKTDVAIVGGGPGGTACALALAQRGIRSVLIEKEAFPRYHIGESMTGECGNAVRALGLEDEMIKRRYPVKHGVRVFNPTGAHSFWVPVMGRDPEKGLFEASTWQVPRSDFDALMLGAALDRGVEYLQGEARAPLGDREQVKGVRVRSSQGAEVDLQAQVVVDASGQSSFLAQSGILGRKSRGAYDNQIAIFAQVTGAVRDPGRDAGNTLIFYQKPNHWAWFIPLDDEIVSIGVVVPASYFKEQGLSKAEFLAREVHQLNPNLTDRLESIEFVEEARAASNYSYEIPTYTGPDYLCVGDAHRFIDPVFSFGLHFAVKEGQLAAAAIEKHLMDARVDAAAPNPFLDYQKMTTGGMDAIQSVIDAFWNKPTLFALIVHQKHTEDMIDLFAGRVYMDEPSEGLLAVRKVLDKMRGKAA